LKSINRLVCIKVRKPGFTNATKFARCFIEKCCWRKRRDNSKVLSSFV